MNLPDSNSAGEISLDAMRMPIKSKGSKTVKKLISNQQSWTFKSKEPKVAIYRDEEKRIKELYGSRQGLKYKIKLNDKILDPDASNSQSPQRGALKLGKTIEPNQIMQVNIKKMHEKKDKDDIFGTQSKLPLGPSDYQIKVDLTKKLSPSLGFDSRSS